ncbi:hypothetical protein TNCV_3544661 [Trichonephila clavipes]|nr:hypothetical protein TNCV_3544661 [Trichonephila clavipes]
MATGSYMTPIYSRSQSEVQGDFHKLNINRRGFLALGGEEAEIYPRQVLDESRSFFRVHTGYFSNIPKCIKAEFIASWGCSQSSVVSSSQH